MNSIVQLQFYKFHDAIKLEGFENKEVAAKRDMLIEEIRSYLKKKSEETGKPLITFSIFNQGSYAMGTGNKPAHEEDDYDIDAGILFNISKDDYGPVEVKRWVFEALDKKQFRTVEWKKACIRVQYTEAGMPKFHVDFACYSAADCNSDKRDYLARGKETSPASDKKWEESQPKKLRDLIGDKFKDSQEKAQFLRVIRYYKRWKDETFFSVNGKPTGIALTSLAYNGFVPRTRNIFNGTEEVDDLKAVLDFTKYILSQFGWKRISTKLPVLPYNDLFEKMTDDQCSNFKERLERLKKALERAQNEVDPHEACKILEKEFGADFPIPPKEETGQTRKKAFAGSSESA